MIPQLSANNFFRYYIYHPQAIELSARDRQIATIASIVLGVLLVGICHLAAFFFYNRSFKLESPSLSKKLHTKIPSPPQTPLRTPIVPQSPLGKPTVLQAPPTVTASIPCNPEPAQPKVDDKIDNPPIVQEQPVIVPPPAQPAPQITPSTAFVRSPVKKLIFGPIFFNPTLEKAFPQINLLEEASAWNKARMHEWELLGDATKRNRIFATFTKPSTQEISEKSVLKFLSTDLDKYYRNKNHKFNILTKHSFCLIGLNHDLRLKDYLKNPRKNLIKFFDTHKNSTAIEYYKKQIDTRLEILNNELNFSSRLQTIPFAGDRITLSMLLSPWKESGLRLALMTREELNSLDTQAFRHMSPKELAIVDERVAFDRSYQTR